MRLRRWIGVGLLGLGVLVSGPAWGADPDPFEKPTTTVNNAATTSAGSQQVAAKIASELNAACKCTTYSASSVSAQRTKTGWGWGEVLIADRLALAISQQSKVSFSTALGQVTTARQQGTGWGAIAHTNGLNLGSLVSSVEKSANAVANAGKAGDNAAKGQSHGSVAASGGQGNSGQGAGAAAGHGGAGAGGGQGGGGGAGQGGGGGGGGHGGGGGNGGGGGGGGGAGGGGKK
jgi:hypothetical protein